MRSGFVGLVSASSRKENAALGSGDFIYAGAGDEVFMLSTERATQVRVVD